MESDSRQPAVMQITYLAEAFEGETLDITAVCPTPGRISIMGSRSSNLPAVFRVEVMLEN